MGYWNTLRIGASALAAQRLRLDVISNNIANAETTRTANGGPFQRQDVVFSAEGQPAFYPFQVAINDALGHRTITRNAAFQPRGVRVTQLVTDKAAGPRVLDPSHPDADADGYVTYPNVNLVTEMTNMMSATRSYEANVNMVAAARRMANKALEIGR